MSDATRGVARLQAQLEVTQTRLEEELKEKATLAKSVREIERQVRQANQSLAEKEKSEARLKEDIEKLEQKTKKLRQQIEDMVGKVFWHCQLRRLTLENATLGSERDHTYDGQETGRKRGIRIPGSSFTF